MGLLVTRRHLMAALSVILWFVPHLRGGDTAAYVRVATRASCRAGCLTTGIDSPSFRHASASLCCLRLRGGSPGFSTVSDRRSSASPSKRRALSFGSGPPCSRSHSSPGIRDDLVIGHHYSYVRRSGRIDTVRMLWSVTFSVLRDNTMRSRRNMCGHSIRHGMMCDRVFVCMDTAARVYVSMSLL